MILQMEKSRKIISKNLKSLGIIMVIKVIVIKNGQRMIKITMKKLWDIWKEWVLTEQKLNGKDL